MSRNGELLVGVTPNFASSSRGVGRCDVSQVVRAANKCATLSNLTLSSRLDAAATCRQALVISEHGFGKHGDF